MLEGSMNRENVDSKIKTEDLCNKSRTAIRYLSSTSTSLIKRKDWIAVCFHESLINTDSILHSLRNHGYDKIVWLSWGEFETSATVLTTTEENINLALMHLGLLGCVIFSGEPDWIVLYERTLDYLLICGEEKLVEEIMGHSKEEAFASIEEVITESRYISDIGKQHFKDLLYKLRVIYPEANPGSEIIFEFT